MTAPSSNALWARASIVRGVASTLAASWWIRVELTPGGVLSKKLNVSARARRWTEVTPGKENSPLELAPGSPIAPGAYTLDVTVPVYTDEREGQVHLKSALNIVAK